jgi:hypothetical protein
MRAQLDVTPELQEGGEWFVDIDLGPLTEDSYRPFVELALARYQPMSLERLHLSPVVHTDVTQLLPGRTLILTHEDARVSGSLRGLRSDQPLSRVEVWLERWSDPLGDPPSTDFMTLDPAPVPGLIAWVRVTEVNRAAAVNQIDRRPRRPRRPVSTAPRRRPRGRGDGTARRRLDQADRGARPPRDLRGHGDAVAALRTLAAATAAGSRSVPRNQAGAYEESMPKRLRSHGAKRALRRAPPPSARQS